MGTRFVASAESYSHENYKQRIAEIDDEGTTRSRCFTGKPCRVIRNETTDAWEDRASRTPSSASRASLV